MRYAEYPPSPALAGLVRCYWTLDDAAVPGGAPPETIFPDGCMEFVFHLGARFQRHDGTRWRVQPRAVLAGQFRSFLTLRPTGATQIVAARFQPGGAWPLVGRPLDAFAGRTPDLEDVLGPPATAVLQRLGDATAAAARVRILDDFLVRRLERQRRVHDAVAAATQVMARTRGHVGIDELAAFAGTSGRHLERLFRREVGLTPKLLCRVLRFQGVFDHVDAAASPDWTTVALAAGYFDQAHFIRDFRGFTGSTPARWLAERPRLAGLLLSGAA